IMSYVGIDISKDSFVVAFSSASKSKTITYQNDDKGIEKFINTLDKEQHHCVMEATGNYGVNLLYHLCEQEIKVSLINPKQSNFLSKMKLSTAKTDNKDARLLVEYGEKMNPEVYKMPSDKIILLKQKQTVLTHLIKQRTASKNQLKSLELLNKKDNLAIDMLKNNIDNLDKLIDNLEKDIVSITEEEFEKQVQLLTSIKGIGKKVATTLVIITNGFSFFENPKQLSRYIGICPTYQQSGKSLNYNGHINRNGHSTLRGQLFIASWSAAKYNSSCKALFERLREEGKPWKLAQIAVCNKLIRQAFAVIKSGVAYIDGHVPTLSVPMQTAI
ncbi:IS110 family transposase, partial [Capnocytophaga genosp. AHN8471]|uniref:IS110 family transposase n=1 Tax=Capnocytophaga genosp. AHN8471 TaxID=327574 RepID=UPI001EE434FE